MDLDVGFYSKNMEVLVARMDQEVGRRGKPEEASVWLLVCLFRLSIMRLGPFVAG